MEISESIYEGVVEPSYKKLTREDANHFGHSKQNRGEAASSWTRLRRVRALTSAENYMWIYRREN